MIDKLNDALELVEQIAHPLANKRGNVGNSSTCSIVKMASLFSFSGSFLVRPVIFHKFPSFQVIIDALLPKKVLPGIKFRW